MKKDNTIILHCGAEACNKWHEVKCSAQSASAWKTHYEANPWFCPEHEYEALGSEISLENPVYTERDVWEKDGTWKPQTGQPGSGTNSITDANSTAKFRALADKFPDGAKITIETRVTASMPGSFAGETYTPLARTKVVKDWGTEEELPREITLEEESDGFVIKYGDDEIYVEVYEGKLTVHAYQNGEDEETNTMVV